MHSLILRRAIKTECGPYAELARLCGQGQSAAQLATFAQGKAAEFEAVSTRTSSCTMCCATLSTLHLRRPSLARHLPCAVHRPWLRSWLAPVWCPAGQTNRLLPPACPRSQDGNTGLVRLAIEGAARRQVQKLTQTYLTLR